MSAFNSPTGKYPFVGITVAAIGGILLADVFPAQVSLCLFAVATTFLAWLAVRKTPLLLLLVSSVFYGLHSLPLYNNPGMALSQLVADREITVQGVAVVDSAASEIASSSGAIRSSFQVKSAWLTVQDVQSVGPVSLFISWPNADPQIGDVVSFEGILSKIPKPRNPAEFDFANWLSRQDIHSQVRVPLAANAKIATKGADWLPRRLAQRTRLFLNTIITKDLSDSPIQAGVISAMILGAEKETPDAIKELFLITGTLHLFSVSGLHIGMLATIGFFGLTLLRVRRHHAMMLTIPLVFAYALITGWNPASVRAAVMTSAFVVSTLLNRASTSGNTLAVACFLILLGNTQQLFATGFQLSFFVVASLIILHNPIKTIFQDFFRPDPFIPRKLLTWRQKTGWTVGSQLSGMFAITLASWLGSVGLTLWYFHLFTPVALLANLFIVPLSFGVLLLGVLALVSFPLSAGLAVLFNNANWGLVSLLLALLNVFTSIPLGSLFVGPAWWQRFEKEKLTVLDLGNGASAILEINGKNWLIDCGSETSYRRVVRPYLQKRGINRVEAIFLTHGDSAHVGGIRQFIIDFPRADIYLPEAGADSLVFKKLQVGNDARFLTQGDRISLGKEAHIEAVWPPSTVDSNRADDHSLVLRLQIGDKSFLLVSDSGFPTERSLLNSSYKGRLAADTLLLGRHRLDPGGLEDFYRAVNPTRIVASAALYPRSENIPRELIDYCRSQDVSLFRMDATGAVEIEIARGKTNFLPFIRQDASITDP